MRNDVKVEGYFIGVERQKKLRSRSVKSADQVARLTNVEYSILEYDSGEPIDRIERDSLVNPLGSANFFKNPRYSEYMDSLVLNAADSFVITNDSNKWQKLLSGNLTNSELFRKYMIRPTFGNSDSEVSSQYVRRFTDYFSSHIPLNDQFSIIRSIHQNYWNKPASSGAFETLSRAGDFFFIYYPFLWFRTLRWRKEWYFDRKIQLGLFSRLDRRLSSILTQKPLADPRNQKDSLVSRGRRFLVKLDYKYRRSGIDYAYWENSDWFRTARNLILNQESNGVDEILRKNAIELDRNLIQFQDYYDLLKIRYSVGRLESGNLL